MPASAEEKAAAAEAFAVAARAAQARSDKQSEILLKAVRPLNESGFLGLVDDLKLQGIQFGWDEDDLDHMYDMTQNDWAPAKYNGLPEKAKKDIQALRQKLALKNAYVIIKKKCQGHKVEHLIKDIPVGRPRTVMNRIHNHFYPDDAAGKGKQSKKFLMATMSSTNTTIVDWIKHVDSAAILVSVGGTCDDALKTCVFLDGLLLPQFSPIKHSVEQIENCDYDMATRKVSNYATNNGLQDLRRSGSEPDARVYNVVDSGQREQRQQPRVRAPRERPPQRTLEEKARLPCPRYSNFQDCRYGAKDCHYSHAGVGGTRADAVRLAKDKMAVASTGHAASDQGRAIEQGLASSTAVQRAPISAPTKPPLARCMLCQSDSHDARACPAAQMADVNLLHSSYMVQDQPANDEDTP